ncbi:ADP-ribosyltransferase family protein [Nocardia stercoris]|uniref:ADP ribosyltransferase domain-containing protein n=1 Tax=Nocardia stercoris TaxID=2483361 RepID=A0A3M2KUF9_9NOCA|nr:hypothetical protein [Nocardia stercoris]RMI29292.1 hypothetical protein EBN03_26505 [Nocardia stercoris]
MTPAMVARECGTSITVLFRRWAEQQGAAVRDFPRALEQFAEEYRMIDREAADRLELRFRRREDRPLTEKPLLDRRLQNSVHWYTSGGHRDLNEALRHPGLLDDPAILARRDELAEALDLLPEFHGIVYRGVDLPRNVLAQYRPGRVVIDRGFVSTSIHPEEMFAGSTQIATISRTGRYVAPFAMRRLEAEVTFKDESAFEILHRWDDPDTGRTVIYQLDRSEDI